jgi:hypothetical protein
VQSPLPQLHNQEHQVFTKEQLLAFEIKREKVEFEGGFVYVRGMDGTERDRWEQVTLNETKKSKNEIYDHMRASIIVRTVCDENGNRLFADEDIPRVSKMPAAVLDKMYTVGARLSGVSKEDAEEIAKNLQGDRSESST